MKWNNVKADIFSVGLAEFSRGWSSFDLVRLISSSKDCPVVIMESRVREDILLHLSSERVELGGLLIGSVVSSLDLERGVTIVKVSSFMDSKVFNSTSVSLSMGAEVWQRANANREPNSFVVGWYHSHPDLGAFFSGTDRKTQRDFFNTKYSVGLVIDPIRNEERWFFGEDSVEIAQENVLVVSGVLPLS
ncbi:Mov34/MPN/PAD-1 family protein [Pseudomonas nunensis]|uniref:Mov34/MPN/PAD-1 family protein n=1 Tax=Pseudomonas nunensis TaxID=2961896 RepID=A0ABY5ENT7_9PSED|nr:Mov34/MPN/PAD-1 family protein [Pseudomonas nunensis]KPN91116.1 hypothetical protein AL066_12510 [Pseudomonas nunensis]MCL5227403.1 Mov34/MPN/PAD-1 family protein [Pseudomonas nunensis]UTO17386.1 Mov34/MPN/PAD-1 family protein [Pseudomonas nunensis]